jgi:uncharacterized protein
LTRLSGRVDVKIVLLPRTDAQRTDYESRKLSNMIIPRAALDGANLVAAADLVVSAGGTMNREASVLGIPAASVYAGKWAAVDEQLVNEGRLMKIASRQDVESLELRKKGAVNPRNATGIRQEIVDLILE